MGEQMEFWKIVLLLIVAVTAVFLVVWTPIILKMARLGWLKEFLNPKSSVDIRTHRNMYLIGIVSVGGLLYVSFAYSKSPFQPFSASNIPLLISVASLVGCLLSILSSFEQSKYKEWCKYYQEILATPGYENIKDKYARAYELMDAGLYSEARPLLEECVARAPSFTPAHKELALVLGKFGDDDGVILRRRLLKQLDSADTVNRYNLANTLGRLGRIDEALQEAEDLLKTEGLKNYDDYVLQQTKELVIELEKQRVH